MLQVGVWLDPGIIINAEVMKKAFEELQIKDEFLFHVIMRNP